MRGGFLRLHSQRIGLLWNGFHVAFRLTGSEQRKEHGEK